MKIRSAFLTLLFAALIISAHTVCSEAPSEERSAEAVTVQTSETGGGNGSLYARKNAGRRGQQKGKRGLNRDGRNRRTGQVQTAGLPWGKNDVIQLTDAEEKAVKIKTVKAAYRSLSSQLSAMGKVLANQYRKAIVSYPFSARIARIDAKIGDWVKAGQKLIVLQSEEVGEATSAFYKANADFELANVNFAREKRLFEKGVGAKKNYLVAEAELKVAEANLNAAEKKLHVLGFTEEEIQFITKTHQINPIISLFAPIDGKIVNNNAILGGMVDQSTEILTIMDPTLLWVDADIYEKDIAKIEKGQNVAITVPAYPGETFMGKISYISDILNEKTHTITVRTEVKNKLNKLKPGMFANLTIFFDFKNKALALPADAILDDKGQKLIFVKEKGKYFPRLITVGNREDHFVEILSGIKEGDEVVTNGNFQLKSKLYEQSLKKAGVH